VLEVLEAERAYWPVGPRHVAYQLVGRTIGGLHIVKGTDAEAHKAWTFASTKVQEVINRGRRSGVIPWEAIRRCALRARRAVAVGAGDSARRRLCVGVRAFDLARDWHESDTPGGCPSSSDRLETCPDLRFRPVGVTGLEPVTSRV